MMRAARARAARIIALLATVAFPACSDGPGASIGGGPMAEPATQPVATAATTGMARQVVDSILPIEEEVRRFQAGLVAPAGLQEGASSREMLVRRFVERLAARDTTGLLALTITRAEFAFVLYPASSYTRPPYRTPPGLVWMQLEQDNRVGLRRLLRADFREPTYVRHDCGEPPIRDGGATLWRGCRVLVELAGGDTIDARLFGVIVQHGERFKLASLQTDF